MDEPLKRTPLYEWHVAQGARMVPFAGWEMPVMYKSPIDEHHLTRRSAGLFDIDHMGQVEISGPDAKAFVNNLVSWDIDKMVVWDAHYGLMCYENGTIVDDVFIYYLPEAWYIVINASNREKDVAWMHKHAEGYDVKIDDVSDNTVMLALQGPNAFRLLDQMNTSSISDMPRFSAAMTSLNGIPVLVGRTGYTGEDGYEISVPNDHAEALARKLTAEAEVEWIGLGARDSLRLECGLCLYGHDLDTTTTPVEASLLWGIQKVRRTDGERAGGFPGADIILEQIATKDVQRKRVGLVGQTKAPVRESAELFDAEDNKIGVVTSGTAGPNAGKPVSMAYVRTDLAAIGTEVFADVRGKKLPMTVEKMPFVPQRYYRG